MTNIRVYVDILSEPGIPLASKRKSWGAISTLTVFEHKGFFRSRGLNLRAMALQEERLL